MEIYAAINREQKTTYENPYYFKPIIPSPRINFPNPSTLPLVHHVPGIEDLQKAPYNLEVVPQEYLFNRLQWYYVTCTFADPEGKPTFVGYPVQFDSDITFVDGRRRSSSPNEIQNSNRIVLTITGKCSSGRELRKCTRCCEKDKARIKRKRKRDTNLSWNQTDEDNNTKLIQVLTSGDEKVGNDGKIKFRLRVACCIGVNKQHHMNHYPTNGANGGEREIHRGCEGMALTVTSHGGGLDYTSTSVTHPIRILGKVTAADRQKFNDNKEPDSPQSIPASVFVPLPNRATMVNQEMGIPGPDPYGVVGNRPPMGISNPFPPDIWLYSIVENDPARTLHNFAMNYKKGLDKIFCCPIRAIFEVDFFTQTNLENIPNDSPLMAEVYTTLAAGASVTNSTVVEPLMKHAVRLQTALLETKLNKEMDVILFADSLNRTAQYYGTLGQIVNARYYNTQSVLLLDSLVSAGFADILNNPVYESVIWGQITYNLDLHTLQSGYEWAKARARLNTMAYSLFLIIFTLCNPEAKTCKSRAPVLEKQKTLLLSLCSQLNEVIDVSKYRDIKQGRRTYAKLIDNGVGSLKHWLSGDNQKAGQCVEVAAIQSALLSSHGLETFIPSFFAAFVGIQLLSTDPTKFSDVTELLLLSITKIHVFKWARVLTDLLICSLERFVGKVDISWDNTVSEDEHTTRHCLRTGQNPFVPTNVSGGHSVPNGHSVATIPIPTPNPSVPYDVVNM